MYEVVSNQVAARGAAGVACQKRRLSWLTVAYIAVLEASTRKKYRASSEMRSNVCLLTRGIKINEIAARREMTLAMIAAGALSSSIMCGGDRSPCYGVDVQGKWRHCRNMSAALLHQSEGRANQQTDRRLCNREKCVASLRSEKKTPRRRWACLKTASANRNRLCYGERAQLCRA